MPSRAPHHRSSSARNKNKPSDKNKRRDFRRNKGGHKKSRPVVVEELPQGPPSDFSGVLECVSQDTAFVRGLASGLLRRSGDPILPRQLRYEMRLRNGVFIEGVTRQNRKGKAVVTEIARINGLSPEAWCETVLFENGTVIAPVEHLVMEAGSDDVSMRIVDLITPIGLGQRALVVAAARTGKTILLQKMAQSVAASGNGKRVVMLLVDERPEEITDMRRNVEGEIFGSSNDHDAESHLHLALLTMDYVKRWVEVGEDVVLFLDSLTRLGRAFNRSQHSSGRTMSGGVDIKALELPRKIFGAARKIENGGSLTIVATILVDTGSRMDEVIFEEFKGTGNSEIVLDRALVEERIFPAVNIAKSGTRREELLWGDSTEMLQMLRRYLSKLPPREATLKLIEIVKKTPDNTSLIAGIRSGTM